MILYLYTIAMQTTYKVNKNLVFQKTDKGLVGFDTDRLFLYTFNETASYIFAKIKLGWGTDKISSALATKYDTSILDLSKDVKILMKDMVKNKIIYLTKKKNKN